MRFPVTLTTNAGAVSAQVDIEQLVIASWTGRNRAAMEGRLVELETMGIARPPALPMFYRVASARLTTETSIDVPGDRTSGEVEFVLLRHAGRIWVGVGSDHTDRAVEGQDAMLSKQLCEKPVGRNWWAFDELEGHWDALRLRSYVTGPDGQRRLYQDGAVDAMLPPRELLRLWNEVAAPHQNGVLFCGTLPSIGGMAFANRFDIELEDPVLKRRISHAYDIVTLPKHLQA